MYFRDRIVVYKIVEGEILGRSSDLKFRLINFLKSYTYEVLVTITQNANGMFCMMAMKLLKAARYGRNK